MKTLLVNGKIYSCCKDDRVYGSILFDESGILELSETIDPRSKYSSDINIIDLRGKTVLPGFIDAHNHLFHYSTAKLGVDCLDEHISSLADMLKAIDRKAGESKNNSWLRVSNFDETEFPEKRHPTLRELDAVSHGKPVVILRKCLHELMANSKALALSGVSSDTASPVGGIVQKNEAGEPTGVMKDTAMDIVRRAMGPFSVTELAEALRLGYRQILSEGITTVHETGVGLMQSLADEMRAFQLARSRGDLAVRTRLYLLNSKALDKAVGLGLAEGFGDEWLNIGGVKFYEDGAFSIHTAGMSRPYENTADDCGILLYEKDELHAQLQSCHLAGLQTSVHAIGDRAVDETLQCFERIGREHGWNDMRHRIEHFTISNPSFIERAKNCGIVIMGNVSEIYFYGDSLAENVGIGRAKNSYPLRSIIDGGIPLACGSDRPCGGGNPFVTIRTAIERKTRDGLDLSGNQSISVKEGIRIWTSGSAYAEFSESRKGTLEKGKLADLVVLDGDPYTLPPSELTDIKVVFTFIDGRMSYDC